MADVHNVGKFLYIEPTNPNLNLPDNAVTFPYEDYSMGVNLEVTISDRFSCGNISKNGRTLSFSSDKGTISFFGGSGTDIKDNKQGYLSTNYTDVTPGNIGRGNKETLGIESINISYQQWFYPIVNIRFVDVRGTSLFMAQEKGMMDAQARGERDITQIDSGSFFKAIFACPSPVFKLTVKGFYGEPVSYNLRMSSFRADFDGATGNIIASVDFIGNMYGVYTEIPLIYTTIAPYIDKEYWDENKDGRFKFTGSDVRKPTMLTFVEFYKALKSALETKNEEEKKAEEQAKNKIGEAESNIKIIEEVIALYPFTKLPLVDLETEYSRKTYKFLIRNDNNIHAEISKESIVKFYGRLKELKEKYPNKDFGTFGSEEEYSKKDYFCKYIVDKKDNNNITVTKYDSEGNGFTFRRDNVLSIEDREYNVSNTVIEKAFGFDDDSKPNDIYYIHLVENGVIEELKRIIEEERNVEGEVNKQLTELHIKKVNEELGFNLSIKNVFQILFAHLDTFVHSYYNTLHNIENNVRPVTSRPFSQWIDFDFVKDRTSIVPPYPLCLKEETVNKEVRTVVAWPEGEGKSLPIAEETKFVVRMLNAANDYENDVGETLKAFEEQKKKEQENNGDSSTVSESDISERDFVPLTLYDMGNYDNLTYKNPYKYIADSNKDDKTKAQLITATFVLRCFYAFYNNKWNDNVSNLLIWVSYVETLNIYRAFGSNMSDELRGFLIKGKASELVNETVGSVDSKNTPPWLIDNGGKGIIDKNGNYTFIPNKQYPKTSDFNLIKKHFEDVKNGSSQFILLDTNSSNSVKDDFVIKEYGNYFQNVEKNIEEAILPKQGIFNESNSDLKTYFSNTEKENKHIFKTLKYDNDNIGVEYTGDFCEKKYEDIDKKRYTWDKVKEFSKINENTYYGVITNKDVLSLTFGLWDNENVKKLEKNGIFKNCSFYEKQNTNEAKAYLFLFSIGTNKRNNSKDNKKEKYSGTDLKYFLLREGAYYWRRRELEKNNKRIDPIVGNYPGFTNTEEVVPCLKDGWLKSLFNREFNVVSLIENQKKEYISWKDFQDERLLNGVTEAREENLIDYFIDFATSNNSVFSEFRKLEGEVSDEEYDKLQRKLVSFLTSKVSYIDYGKPISDGKSEFGVDKYATTYSMVLSNIEKIYTPVEGEDTTDQTNGGENTDDLNTGVVNDDDIRLSTYLMLKNMYDKFFANLSEDSFTMGKPDNEYEKFLFVDTYYNPIGDRLLCNGQYLCDIIKNTIFKANNTMNIPEKLDKYYSVFEFMSEVCQKNNLTFLALPQKFGMSVNENGVSDIENMFKPHPFNSKIFNNTPITGSYVALYPYTPSERLDIRDDSGQYGYKSDGFDITDNSNDLPVSLKTLEDTDKAIPAFAVSFGKQNQSFFKNISLTTSNQQITEHSIIAQMDISGRRSMSEGPAESTIYGQDLYRVYSNYSYQCTVEMMGNVQIMPLMYFQLNNISMWHGAYMVIAVEHNIVAGNMTTKFTGVRVNRNAIPFVKNGYIYMHDGQASTYTGDESDTHDEGSTKNGDVGVNNDTGENVSLGSYKTLGTGYDNSNQYKVEDESANQSRKRAVTEAVKRNFKKCFHPKNDDGTYKHLCTLWAFNLARDFSKKYAFVKDDNCKQVSSETGNDGPKNPKLYEKLEDLGYTQVAAFDGVPSNEITSNIDAMHFEYGDVLLYFGSGGDSAVTKSMHTQFYVGDAYKKGVEGYDSNINIRAGDSYECSCGWASDMLNNYGTKFVYAGRAREHSGTWVVKLFRLLDTSMTNVKSPSEPKKEETEVEHTPSSTTGGGTAKKKRIENFIKDSEGKSYVNDKDDKGGCTKWGVTIGTLSSVMGEKKTCEDVKNMTAEEWQVVFDYFYNRMMIDGINNSSIALLVYDMGWGSGIVNAIKHVQRCLGCIDDGIMGNETLNAINSGNPKETFDKLWKMREQWFIDMKQPKYLNGWLKRLNRITFEY